MARLDLGAEQVAVLDAQAHTARALWNLLHEYFTFRQGRFATLKDCDAAIRTARHEINWMGQLPAQAAQAVLKTYRQAWANFLNPDHPARRPTFKGRGRSRLAVDVPQARDLQITRVNRRWGAINLPKVGRVRFRWTRDLPGLTRGGPAGRITGARLVKDAHGWQVVFRTQTLLAPAPTAHPGHTVGIDRGGHVVKVPAPGTSQTCHRCGHRDANSRDKTVFACTNPACGWVGHADTNAAINIKNAVGTPVSGRGDLGATRSAKRQPPRAA